MNTKKTKDSELYNHLSRKVLRGEASPQEMNELSQWDIITAKMKQQFEKAATEKVDDEVGRRMWNRIDEKCDVTQKRPTWRNNYWKISIAACITLLLTVGTIWITQTKESSPITEYLTVSAYKNQLYTLPDSSKVWMEVGSSIRFTKDFEKSRNIWLTGKSTFEVRKNGTPFLVNINQAFIEVKGTVFQVWNRGEKEQSEVILFSGRIDFNTASGQQIKMIPHQRILYNPENDNILIEATGNMNWENGIYRFTDMRLDSLVEIVQKLYHTPITVSTTVNQKHLFTGTIKHDDPIIKVIERICFNMSCNYKTENEKIIIYK